VGSEDVSKFVFDPKFAYLDEAGNLRVGSSENPLLLVEEIDPATESQWSIYDPKAIEESATTGDSDSYDMLSKPMHTQNFENESTATAPPSPHEHLEVF
jgi:hypothetical protein